MASQCIFTAKSSGSQSLMHLSYGIFIPNLSMTLNPLNELLRKNIKWRGSAAAEKSFKQAKELLTSASVLAYYDRELPLCLAADASAYGI